MSGLSLAVGRRPNQEATAGLADVRPAPAIKRQGQAVVGGVMGSLRVIELQLVAFIMVFSASGLVPFVDLVFPAFTTLYILALSRFAFPSAGSCGGRELFEGSRAFRAYVVAGTTVGLFLPLAYVLGGFARGDDHAVRSATPHLFLLSCQILTENVIAGMGIFSPPVRAIVPLLYTVRRVFVIIDWIYDVWINKPLPTYASINDVAWTWFGRSLATANLLYFSINLFAFMIPRFLPRAFEKYLKEREEIYAKTAEDKRARAAMDQRGGGKSVDGKKMD
ncbi:uncharacterized protein LOC122024804 [Zingiber officinale]|uniref:DUF7733 domain-containing protein n=1 Tax=Zingiber officinale TaxID=94328 RepID=A0A8J5EYD4_ZINOF|nr:uncharacterized protein LOC122024804 [Zingiber officinale]KAG6477204.1 hypothetical protein ZIOFF_066456 [Zingiber officinale]